MSSSSKDGVRFLVCCDLFTNCLMELSGIFRYLEHLRCYDSFSCGLKSLVGLKIRSLELLCSPWRNDGSSTVLFLSDCEYIGLDYRHGRIFLRVASLDNLSFVCINLEELPKLKDLSISHEEDWLDSLSDDVLLILDIRSTLKRLIVLGLYTVKILCLSTIFLAVENVIIVNSRFASILGDFKEVRSLSLQKWRYTLNDPEIDYELEGIFMLLLSSLSIETDLLDEWRKLEAHYSEFWEEYLKGLTQLNVRHDERNIASILSFRLVDALRVMSNLETFSLIGPGYFDSQGWHAFLKTHHALKQIELEFEDSRGRLVAFAYPIRDVVIGKT